MNSFIELLTSARGWIMVILFFGGSIFIHELGHFLAAKWRGLQIDRFSIGFGPRLFGWKRGGVDYRVSLLPLGGYVALPQLAGMQGIEGASNVPASQLKEISFTDKVIVAVAGPVFNVLFALVIGLYLWQAGIPVAESTQSTEIGYIRETTTNENGVVVPSPEKEAGFQIGDKLVAIDGRPIETFGEFVETIALSSELDSSGERVIDFVVERDGELLNLTINPSVDNELGIRYVAIGTGYDVIVGRIFENSPSSTIDLQPGDQIVTADGRPIRNAGALISVVHEKGTSELEFTIKRGDNILTRHITPQLVQRTKDGPPTPMIGIEFQSKSVLTYKNPIEQVSDSIDTTIRMLSALLNPKSDIGIKHMSGAVGIARVIKKSSQQDLRKMLWIVLLINVNLAIFNLLPIPVLDGGHITFAAIAKIRNKPLPPNVIASLQGSFMFVLLGLMIYVTFNDVSHWWKDASAEKQYEENRVEVTFDEEKPEATPSSSKDSPEPQ